MCAVLFFFASFVPLRTLLFFIISVFFHEIGHLLFARLLSLRVRKIGTCAMNAFIEAEESDSDIKNIAFAAGGPIFGILLSLFCRAFGDLLFELSCLSFFLSVLNLLPVSYLDGGRIFRILISTLFRRRTAEKIALIFSISVSFSLCLYTAYRMLKFGDSAGAFFFSAFGFIASSKNEKTREKATDYRVF